jgi:hypothetical protein
LPATLGLLISAASWAGALTGIVGNWHIDEEKGQSVADLSGNKVHGTLGPTSAAEPEDPAWTTRRFDTAALAFDGEDDYVRVPHSNALQPKQISVEAWVKGSTVYLDSPRYRSPRAPTAATGRRMRSIPPTTADQLLRGLAGQLRRIPGHLRHRLWLVHGLEGFVYRRLRRRLVVRQPGQFRRGHRRFAGVEPGAHPVGSGRTRPGLLIPAAPSGVCRVAQRALAHAPACVFCFFL